MRRYLWYYYCWTYFRITFFFFFKKFKVIGAENIPKDRPVLFLPNHQNTFLDALTVAESQPRMAHYMARADVFKSKRLIWLMSTVNLRPIYRMRDGRKAVIKNEQVFNELQDFMSRGECVMMHPEATHNLKYRLRNLNKGFTKLAFGFLDRYPDQELAIVPVGINYHGHTQFQSSVSVIYGKPIDARSYYEMEDQNQAALELRDKVAEEMKPLITHIGDEDRYDEIYNALVKAGADFSDQEATHKMLMQIESGEKPGLHRKKAKPNIIERILYPIVYLNNWAVMLLWKKLKPNFKDRAWHGPIKYALSLSLVPIMYLLQTLIIILIFNWRAGLVYFVFSLITTPILRIKQTGYQEWKKV